MPVLRTATVEGAGKGIVTVRAPHELEDQEVVWLQDALLDQQGLIPKRNGIPAAGTYRINVTTNAVNGSSPLNVCKPMGIVACYEPSGTNMYIMVVWYDATNYTKGLTDAIVWGSIYDSNFTLQSRQPLFHAINAYAGEEMDVPYFNYAMLPDGGVQIMAAYGLESFDYAAAHAIWYGANPPSGVTYSRNSANLLTGTYGVTNGSNVITGSAADVGAKLVAGAIVNGVGIVARTPGAGATSATLIEPFYGVTNAALVASIGMCRVPAPIRSNGLVNCNVASASVSGYGTKFRSISDLTRTTGHVSFLTSQIDGKPIAAISTSSVTTNTGGVTVTAYRDGQLEPYLLRPIAPSTGLTQEWPNPFQVDGETSALNPWNMRTRYTSQRLGIIVANYGGYTFWANSPNVSPNTNTVQQATNLSSRVWIAGPTSPFEIDHSPDGTWFDVKSEKADDLDIMALASVPNGVVIGKRNSVWFLQGSSPDDFQLNKLHDDGIFGPQAIVNYKGGVIWANKSGIWSFDGSSSPVNLLDDTMLNKWVQVQSKANTGWGARGWFMCVYRDYLFFNNIYQSSGGLSTYDGKSLSNTYPCFVMYLPNRACTIWSNFLIQGYLPPVGTLKSGYILMTDVQNYSAGANKQPFLVNMDAILDRINLPTAAVLDTTSCTIGTPAGRSPCFYMETRRYDLGDAMNRKVWKGLALESNFSNASDTARLMVDYVTGLNSTGTTVTTAFSDTLDLFKAQRIKFRARDQFMGFRIYEDTSNRALTVTLAPWQIMYKPGRPGAI